MKVLITEQELKDIIREAIDEAFKSPKLSRLSRENGGIEVNRNGGDRSYPTSFMFGNRVDPSEINDACVTDDIFDSSDSDFHRKRQSAIGFNNGKHVALDASKQEEPLQAKSDEKRHRRAQEKIGAENVGDSGDHDKGKRFHNSFYDSLPQYYNTDYNSPTDDSFNAREMRKQMDFHRNKPFGKESDNIRMNVKKRAADLLGKRK